MQDTGPLSDHVDEFILRRHWLSKADLLIGGLYCFNYGGFFFLKLKRDKACFVVFTLDKDRTCMEKANIDFGFLVILLVEEWIFQVLELAKDNFLGFELIFASNSIWIVASQISLHELPV